MRTFVRVSILTVLAAMSVFAGGRRSIADIEANPSKYEGKKVTVVGVVKDGYGLSIPGAKMGGGAYKIDDGTGSIWVMVTDGAIPVKGSEISVEGRVANGANWKGKNYGLGIYESKRKYTHK